METMKAATPINSHVVVATVCETYDYSKFKILHGNRNLELPHLHRLTESIRSEYLMCPIIVNEAFQIIDGQNRFTVCKDLGLPIHYIMAKGYGLKEVQILNSNNRTWDKYNFLDSYCKQGVKPYLQFKSFMDMFPDFRMHVCSQLLSNSHGADKETKVGRKRIVSKDFENGKLVIKDFDKAVRNAKKIMDFKAYYKGFNRKAFVAAMITLLKHKNYNHDVMIGKLKKHPVLKIYDMPSAVAYIMQLEEMYNYKNKNKVTLKYNG